jgi:hypothetical protein
MRFAAAGLILVGLALAVTAGSRFAGLYARVLEHGAEGAGLVGPQSGPDSRSRATLLAALTSCRSDYRTAIGRAPMAEVEALLDRCVVLAEAFVAEAPADCWGWLQLATVRLERHGAGEPALAALRRSWSTGEADGAVLPARPALALRFDRLLDADDRRAFSQDLAASVRHRADLDGLSRYAVTGEDALALVRSAMQAMSVDDQEVLLASLKDAAAGRAAR